MMTELMVLDLIVGIAALLTLVSLIGLWSQYKSGATPASSGRDAQAHEQAFAAHLEALDRSHRNHNQVAMDALNRRPPGWLDARKRAAERDQEAAAERDREEAAAEEDREEAAAEALSILRVLGLYYPKHFQKTGGEGAMVGTHRVAGIAYELIQGRLAALDVASARSLFAMLLLEARMIVEDSPGVCTDRLTAARLEPPTLLSPRRAGLAAGAAAAMLEQLALRPAPPAEPIDRSHWARLSELARDIAPADLLDAIDDIFDGGPLPDVDAECPPFSHFHILMIEVAIRQSPEDLRRMLALAAFGKRTGAAPSSDLD